MSILRLQQEELARLLRWDVSEKQMEAITRQTHRALTAFRERREWFGENSHNRKALENLWEVSVEIAKLERSLAPPQSHEDPPFWLHWHRREWPCVY